MKLLIVTQKVDRDDENLGAFYRWFEEFGRLAGEAVIIAGNIGNHALPGNVRLYGFGAGTRLGRIWKFWEVFSREYAECDAVFFHQIPEFVIAAAPFLLARPRPSALWYAHKSVTWKLKLAERLVRTVFTSSEAGFRLPSKKVMWVGQAVDTEFFSPATSDKRQATQDALHLITIGRISPIKNYEAIIDAMILLENDRVRPWTLDVIGGPLMPRDTEYMAVLKRRVEETGLGDHIRFLGPRRFSEIPAMLREHDVFINMSQTGSLDKAVLEAMSCGLSVITTNEAYRDILPPQYFLVRSDPGLLAERIRTLASEQRPNMALRTAVISHHSLERTIKSMMDILTGKTDKFSITP